MDLGLCETVKVLFLLDHYDLLWREVVKREHQSPVEVAFSVHRTVVNIRLLGVVLAPNPAEDRCVCEREG